MALISKDTKYFLKLSLTRSTFFKSALGIILLVLAKLHIIRKNYWIFSRLLGKYEKLYENEIRSKSEILSNTYRNLEKQRIFLLQNENHILRSFKESPKRKSIANSFSGFTISDTVRMRYPNEDDPDREGDLLIFKEPIYIDGALAEKGVLYLQYNRAIYEFSAIFDLKKVYSEYHLIVEPSSWGYSDISLEILLYGDNRIFVMAQDEMDFYMANKLDPRVIPIRAGAGDWIDLDAFDSNKPLNKAFDVCMVASWRKLKNHKLLFKQLSLLGKGLRIALVGYPWENRTAASIRREQALYFPDSIVSIFESVPHRYVFDVLASSRVALMLSEREGANRAIYEALSTDTPVVMLSSNRGVNKNLVEIGCVVLADENTIHNAVKHLLDASENLNVRAKLESVSGYKNTWKRIDATLISKEGIRLGDNPLVKSQPNLKYIEPQKKEYMQQFYKELERCLDL